MKLSARNQLKGKIVEVKKGATTAQGSRVRRQGRSRTRLAPQVRLCTSVT